MLESLACTGSRATSTQERGVPERGHGSRGASTQPVLEAGCVVVGLDYPTTKEETVPELGKRYRDPISGFEGVATGRYEFLHGCVRWQLAGQIKGEPKDFVFDEPQLVEVADEVTYETTRGKGGPVPLAPRTGLS